MSAQPPTLGAAIGSSSRGSTGSGHSLEYEVYFATDFALGANYCQNLTPLFRAPRNCPEGEVL